MIKKRFIVFFTVLVGIMLVLAACSDSSGGGGGDARIAIGPPASSTNTLSKAILSSYGVEDGDFEEFQEGFGDAADGVQDGNIDISVGVLGLPAGSIESLQASTGDVVMLEISDDVMDEVEEKSGYERFMIPQDTYDFLESDVQTVAAYAILMGNTDTIDEELGYELARLMVENADEMTHAQAAQMTLDNALNGAKDIPMHPGAARYYEEQGLEFDNPIADLSADEGSRKDEFILGTGSQGGTYYPLGGEMATLWNNHLDSNFTNMETGASVENMATIGEGNMDLGMAVHVPALNAINGEGDFEDNQIENAAFIGHIYPEVAQIITRESTGIESLDTLK
ncbi:TAXI family TRAP transporter solute-binding subunit [Virgibacillus sp. W0181]|uniref:TAXI family TRAP transporter solute-binding subunit n=1 Tax=Virgibacillus sp. W0181 TaxID=3391581 RepID=UPI003F44FA67